MAWALYEWAQQPYWALIATFIFTPYFAAGFVGDAARGQSLLGYAGAVSGLAIAVFSPWSGPASTPGAILAPGWSAWPFRSSWPAPPCGGGPGDASRILPILGCLVVAGVVGRAGRLGDERPAAPGRQAGPGRTALGHGLGPGLCRGADQLFIVLLCFSLPKVPMLGLSKALHEPDRIVGPLVAVWFLVFAWPLMASRPSRRQPRAKAVGRAVGDDPQLPRKPHMLSS
jgi:UMF1 family MFS transporter